MQRYSFCEAHTQGHGGKGVRHKDRDKVFIVNSEHVIYERNEMEYAGPVSVAIVEF